MKKVLGSDGAVLASAGPHPSLVRSGLSGLQRGLSETKTGPAESGTVPAEPGTGLAETKTGPTETNTGPAELKTSFADTTNPAEALSVLVSVCPILSSAGPAQGLPGLVGVSPGTGRTTYLSQKYDLVTKM